MTNHRTQDDIDLIRRCRIAVGAELLGSEVWMSELDADAIAKSACHRGHLLAYAILEAERIDRRPTGELLREINGDKEKSGLERGGAG